MDVAEQLVDGDAGSGAPGEVRKLDGRVVRGSRNRLAIVDAIIDLNLAGVLRPSLAQVAEQAGVSERSVFRHFADMASLHEAAARRHLERIAPLLVDVAPEGPFDDRVDRFVRTRAALLEANTPVRMATDLRAPFYPELRAVLARARHALRRQVARTFSPELDALDETGRDLALDTLDVATCWDTWRHWRDHQGLSYERAEAAMRRSIAALLSYRG